MSMAKINPEHLIDEIRENIKTGDRLKARLVLDCLGQVDEKTRQRIIYELSRAPASFAIPMLNHLLSTDDRLDARLPIVRETLISLLIAYPDELIACLGDEEIDDKTIFIRTAGEIKLSEAVPALVDLLARTEDAPLISLIIETLGIIGDPQAINTLGDFLYAADRDFIISAIRALGQIGDPSAMHRLAERMGTDNELDLMILSVFAEVQDGVSLEKLNDALRSHHAHMRTYAKKELVRIGNKAVPVLLANLTSRDNDFLVHTLNVLGDIGDESAVKPIRQLLDTVPRDPNVRFAAYEALALLPLKQGAYTLAAGLTDAEDHVCIAAARAIDKNFSPILAAGIKNLIREDGAEARHIVKIIVNAQVDKLFLALAGEDSFQKKALIYLPHAHQDIRDHYVRLLKREGMDRFAALITGEEDEESCRPLVCAVDDSRMILNIYKATLHELGFEPILFEFPAGAIEWLKREKPLMVLTDLNMPDITGIDLTRKIREKYPPRELPVIMVTTQSDQQDHEAARKAGVSSILTKPFNARSLKKAMAEFVDIP